MTRLPDCHSRRPRKTACDAWLSDAPRKRGGNSKFAHLQEILRHIMPLPPCDYRVELPDTSLYYCRHKSLIAPDNLVDASLCWACRVREQPCPHPRPMPDVLDKLTENSTAAPSLPRRAWNLTKALLDFVADGARTVDQTTYEKRLTVCDGCEERQGNSCRQCGCRLGLKARGRAFQCPLGRWEESEES